MSVEKATPLQTSNRPTDTENLRLREVEGWVHHVADLNQDTKVITGEAARPIGLRTRFTALRKRSIGDNLKPGMLAIAERSLTPRHPYLAAPLSYLDAGGHSWSLYAETDRLEWAEFLSPDARSGPLEFWFRNVAVGTAALVTFELTVGSTGPGVTGSYEVRSSDAAPRQFLATGFKDHTVDLIVRPSLAYAVLVTLNPGAGIGYLAFRRAEYLTL